MIERSLRLVEYQPRLVRLPTADVAALSHWSNVLKILPTTTRHTYRVTSLGYVGTLQAGRWQLAIRPKIPLANVAYLLDPQQPLFTAELRPERGCTLIDLMGRWLARLLHERAAHGLPRQYIEITDQQPFMQGRLDLVAQARDTPTAKDRFHLHREEFTVDSPLHRFAKHTALGLLAAPTLQPETVAQLRIALQGYNEVTAQAFAPSVVQRWWPRLNPSDRELADACWQVANGLQPAELTGSTDSPAYLVNMAQLFERYVTRGLQNFGLGDILAQRPFCYHEPVAAQQPTLVGQPDIQGGTPARWVLDVKWKALGETPPASDVQQVLAYAVGLNCRDVRLLYPSQRSATWVYELPNGGRLTIHLLRVVGSAERCRTAFHRLARSLRPRTQ